MSLIREWASQEQEQFFSKPLQCSEPGLLQNKPAIFKLESPPGSSTELIKNTDFWVPIQGRWATGSGREAGTLHFSQCESDCCVLSVDHAGNYWSRPSIRIFIWVSTDTFTHATTSPLPSMHSWGYFLNCHLPVLGSRAWLANWPLSTAERMCSPDLSSAPQYVNTQAQKLHLRTQESQPRTKTLVFGTEKNEN